MGEGLVFLEDVENPVLEVLPQETMQTLDDLFTETMSPTLSDYFGPLPDLDSNGRLLVVTTDRHATAAMGPSGKKKRRMASR